MAVQFLKSLFASFFSEQNKLLVKIVFLFDHKSLLARRAKIVFIVSPPSAFHRLTSATMTTADYKLELSWEKGRKLFVAWHANVRHNGKCIVALPGWKKLLDAGATSSPKHKQNPIMVNLFDDSRKNYLDRFHEENTSFDTFNDTFSVWTYRIKRRESWRVC